MSKQTPLSFSRSDRSRRGPPDYASRGVQLRLMIVVFSLMLVVVLLFRAGNPDSWRWLTAWGPKAGANVDTRVRPHEDGKHLLPPGSFRAVAGEDVDRPSRDKNGSQKGDSTRS